MFPRGTPQQRGKIKQSRKRAAPSKRIEREAMNVHISSKGRTVSKRVRNFVTNRVEKATQRFTNRISRVEVSVANSDNSIDQECRVVLSVNGQGTIVASAHAENLMAAIVEAVDRAKRGLTKAVGRRRSGRRLSPPVL